jgi:hypothetical protein
MKILVTILIGWTFLLPGVWGETVSVKNEFLQLCADTAANGLTINDSRTGRDWTASFDSCAGSSSFDDWQHIIKPQYESFRLIDAKKTGSCTIRLSVENVRSAQVFFLDAELTANTVAFDLSADSVDLPISCIGLPPLFKSDSAPGHLVFCDRSCGVLKEQSDPEGYVNSVLSTYANTSCLDMPWVGMVDLQKGDGVMILLETPLDSAMQLRKAGQEIWPQPLWKGRLGKLNYRRRVSFHFSDHGGFVALAGMYRDYLQQQNRFKTLAEKVKERPNVARLAGSAPVWADSDAFEFIREARNRGVVNAIVANPERHGHGREETEELNSQGYLTSRYDSYSDIEEGTPWFQRDHIQETAYVLQPGGEPLKGWKTLEGVQFCSRSSAFALRAAKAYSGELIEGQGLNADFIDVMAAMDLFEDYHPEHTFSREQDMKFKREVFQYYNDKKLVLGTEHGNDWCADLVDYTEGALSGSFWWIPGKNKTGWNPGHLQRPVSRDDFSSLYLKYGVDSANRIPLWQLVYHDSLVSTWYWGDSPGWFYEIAPEITDLKDVQTVLYGAMPLFWRDSHRGYDWSKNKDRWLESYYLTVKFHEAVFGEKMVSHEFLTADRLVQKTVLGNGATVTANFQKVPYKIQLNGQEWVLPPNGFYAAAPGVTEGRVLQKSGSVVTFVKSSDLYYCKSDAPFDFSGISIQGEIALFQLDDHRWNLLIHDGSAPVQLSAARLGELTGLPRLKIQTLTSDWQAAQDVPAGADEIYLLEAGAYSISVERDLRKENVK